MNVQLYSIAVTLYFWYDIHILSIPDKEKRKIEMMSLTKRNTAGAYYKALKITNNPEVVAATKIVASYQKRFKDAARPSLDYRDGKIILRTVRIITKGLEFKKDGECMSFTYRGLSASAKWRSPESKPRAGTIVISNIKRV